MDAVKETLEQRRARRDQELSEAREASLKKILAFNRRCTARGMTPWGGGLSFEESGAARLANIAGFLKGLCTVAELSPLEALAATGSEAVGPRELALHLAVSLDEKLSYLASYGGEREFEVEAAAEGREAQVVKAPGYKVVLYDDGTFGGFGILWHRPYTTAQVHAAAREVDEESYQGKTASGEELDSDESSRRWSAALDKAAEKLKLRKELDDSRHWTPSWTKAKRAEYAATHEAEDHEGHSYYGCSRCSVGTYELGGSVEYLRYGFAFNGGLLLHGMGHATFAVRINDGGPGWGVHT